MPLLGRRRRGSGPAISSPIDSVYRQGRANTLTASGMRIGRREAEIVRRLRQPWQSRAFYYYDQLGAIKYAAQFYSKMLAPLRLYAAEVDEHNQLSETQDPRAIEALERIQDPGGGRTGLLSSYGRLMFLTGEAILFVSRDEQGEEQWEMLSTDELRVESGTYQRYRAPALGAEEYRFPSSEDDASWVTVEDGDAVGYRIWQRHPRNSDLADATMQGVLDECEELLLLTQAVRKRARSRLAEAGILFIDANISRAIADTTADDEDMNADPVMKRLTDAISAAMSDEGSMAAFAPIVVRVDPGENRSVADMVHHLQLVDPAQMYPEAGMRNEVIRRIALFLDMPPEALLGNMDSNHWNAWITDEQSWKTHGQQKAQQLVDDLTAVYYRPYLASQGVEDARRFCIAYDETDVVTRPDESKNALLIYDRRAISKKALRGASGYSDADAPTREELAEQVGVAVRDVGLAWYGEPSSPQGGGGGPAAEPDQQESDQTDVVPGPPETSPAEPDATTASLVARMSLVARVSGASEIALIRSREAAGARLRSLAKREPDARLAVQGVPTHEVAFALGRERVRAIKAPADRELVAGAHPLIVQSLTEWGISERVAGMIAEHIEKHAARTLYEKRPRPLPDSFPGYVQGLLEAN